MGEAGMAVGAVMWPLSAVEVHVIYQRGLLCERLVAQRALMGFAAAAVHGHVSGEVGGVVEVFSAAGAGVQQVGGAGVEGERVGGGESHVAVFTDDRPGHA